MSSTEQKNATQPFIDSCHTFGIIPTIISKCFDNYSLQTDELPFEGLGRTDNLGERIRRSANPLQEVRTLFPTLSGARMFARSSPVLLKLVSDSRVYTGNQAVMRFCEAICISRGGMFCGETRAVNHARLHAAHVVSLLSSGAYSTCQRMRHNCRKLADGPEAIRIRHAADVCEYLTKGTTQQQHASSIRRWCSEVRSTINLAAFYSKDKYALEAYADFDPASINSISNPPPLKQKWFTLPKSGRKRLSFYCVGGFYFIKISSTAEGPVINLLHNPRGEPPSRFAEKIREKDIVNELFVLTHRDMQDLAFLLQACANIRLYLPRKLVDVHDKSMRVSVKSAQQRLWELYLQVMRMCGSKWHLRNKLGVYFDVLQWRYLAWRSGDIFYNHSKIMENKIKSKGLEELPDQRAMLSTLRDLPMDIAIDMLGIYKASIYPEVDPYAVVVQQRNLHMSRFETNWQEGSAEKLRFEETKAYMWYLAVRVLHNHSGLYPGKIRPEVPAQDWHARYSSRGIPGDRWREAHDVDLTGCYPVSDITNDQYIRQQDSACAPPFHSEYKNFDALRRAPRRHKRKLLYAIQEPEPPDLPATLEYLNQIGSTLPDGHVDKISYELPFSIDIVTGSRCERHKDAPRPFYAASPPWGCILSYFDGITRDFLSGIPQSMLGKSTKQKFTDLSTAARTPVASVQPFFMSDDKAKYSPHMDPNSQQLPADFFAELFDIPAMKAFGPIMYHCELYYRVNGHLVHYNSNGTDREGMRGASNTWLEIVAQGLTTRLSREKGLLRGKSLFLAFIDDGLRKFEVEARNRSPEQVMETAQKVIDDVIFGLRVLGRELSWDKTFISTQMFVMLNEVIYDGSHFSSGLKSYCTAGDIEMKEVMSAADYEQLYFGKMRGAYGVGCPIDLAHYTYVFETLRSHYAMGLSLQDNKLCSEFDYRLFCITPIALGGAGLRSMIQMNCNEVANTTKEGIGNLLRLGDDRPWMMICVRSILSQPKEMLSPTDFMREPEQMHVSGARIRTQRLPAEVRRYLHNIASNTLSRQYMNLDREGMKVLDALGRLLMSTGDVSAEEVRLLYSSTPVAFLDEFVQKLASSSTLTELLGRDRIGRIRRLCRSDLVKSAKMFRQRSRSDELVRFVRSDPTLMVIIPEVLR